MRRCWPRAALASSTCLTGSGAHSDGQLSASHSARTPEDLKAVLAKLVALAKDGDTAATKIVLDRGLGRVTVAEETTQEVLQLPPLVDAQSCVDAMAAVLAAMSSGAASISWPLLNLNNRRRPWH